MWDFSITRSLWLMARTLPYLLLRAALYFAITIAYLVATGIGAGIGYTAGLAGNFQIQGAFVGGLLGFSLIGGIVYFLREYILYLVKAGQIAVMTELLAGNDIPGSKGQMAYGAELVKARFAEASMLFALDQLIKGVVRTVSMILGTVAAFLPIPGLRELVKLATTVIRLSVTYVDEVILAHNFRLRSTNPWETSRQAIVLYAQNRWVMIRNAIWLAVFSWIVTIAVFVLLLAPASALLYYLPGSWGGFGFAAAIVFAWAFKAALVEPFGIACLMQVYFKTIEGQTPDPEIDAKLMGASAKFRALTEKARSAMGLDGAPKPARGE